MKVFAAGLDCNCFGFPSKVPSRTWYGSRSILTRPGARLSRQAATGRETNVVLMECDGFFVDLHDQGHRVAFNKVFKDFGLECANWSPQIYQDLRLGGDGTAEGMLTTFFKMIGWPMAVATNEREDFVAAVLQKKQEMLRKLLMQGAVPLRDGIPEFLKDALAAGANLGAICGTLSIPKDDVWSCVVKQLDDDVAKKIPSFLCDNQSSSKDDRDESMEYRLQSGIDEVKRREAIAFVNTITHGREDGPSVGIDPHILAGRKSGVSSEWISAVFALLDGTSSSTVLVAGNTSTLKAGAGAGVATIAVPSGLSCRGTYPDAHATFNSIGRGGGLTWNRVESLLQSRQGQH